MSSDKSMPLGIDYVPGPTDVICARGKASLTHPGNLRLRKLVESHLEAYANAKSKIEKTIIVSTIVETIQDENPRSGGFIKPENNQWCRASDSLVREKVGQSLRDLLHNKYQSSKRVKRQRRQRGEAIMNDHIHSLLLKSNCTDISERMKDVGMDSEDPPKTDDEILRVFNEGNMELLRLFKTLDL